MDGYKLVNQMCQFSCGDGQGNGGESCDDANTRNNDGCSSTCKVEPGYVCEGFPSICVGGCGDSLLLETDTYE